MMKQRPSRPERAELARSGAPPGSAVDWLAGLVSFKAVVLEGLEVVFVVIAVGAGRGLLGLASLGALAACLLWSGSVCGASSARARPENTLKSPSEFMLSALVGSGSGKGWGSWPATDLANSRIRSAVPGRRGRLCRPRARSCRRGSAAMTFAAKLLRELAGLFATMARLLWQSSALSSSPQSLLPDSRALDRSGCRALLGCLGVLFANVMKATRR